VSKWQRVSNKYSAVVSMWQIRVEASQQGRLLRVRFSTMSK